jgi:hypothetical protein
MLNFSKISLVLGLSMSSTAAIAATISQTDSIGSAPANWVDNFTYNQFDPSSGTLTGFNLSLTGTLVGNIAVESREAAPTTVSSSLNGNISVSRPGAGGVITTASPTIFQSSSLAAFDGSRDFAGASGRSYTGLTSSATSTTSGSFSASDGALFTGLGTVTLPVTASVRTVTRGGANLAGRLAVQASAEGTLRYDFDPTGTGGGGSSSGGFGFQTSSGGGGFALFPVGTVTSDSQTGTVASQTTGWSNSLSFQKFDPSLGRLYGVNLEVESTLNAQGQFENLEAARDFATANQGATITLKRAGKSDTLAQVANNVSATVTLEMFDGSEDFDGLSGGAFERSASQITNTTLTNLADLLAFSGAGTIDLLLSALGGGSLDTPGNFLFDLLAEADARVKLSYVYLPGAAALGSDVPEPATLSLLGLGLLGLAGRRRAHKKL